MGLSEGPWAPQGVAELLHTSEDQPRASWLLQHWPSGNLQSPVELLKPRCHLGHICQKGQAVSLPRT